MFDNDAFYFGNEDFPLSGAAVRQLPCLQKFRDAPCLFICFHFLHESNMYIISMFFTNKASLGNLTLLSHKSIQSHQESSASKNPNPNEESPSPTTRPSSPSPPDPTTLPSSNDVCGAGPRNCIKMMPRGTIWNLRVRVETGGMRQSTRGWCRVQAGNGYIPCICCIYRLGVGRMLLLSIAIVNK